MRQISGQHVGDQIPRPIIRWIGCDGERSAFAPQERLQIGNAPTGFQGDVDTLSGYESRDDHRHPRIGPDADAHPGSVTGWGCPNIDDAWLDAGACGQDAALGSRQGTEHQIL